MLFIVSPCKVLILSNRAPNPPNHKTQSSDEVLALTPLTLTMAVGSVCFDLGAAQGLGSLGLLGQLCRVMQQRRTPKPIKEPVVLNPSHTYYQPSLPLRTEKIRCKQMAG